VRFSCKVEDFS